MKQVAILGMGSIGCSIARQWARTPPKGHALAGVMVREGRRAIVAETINPDVAIVTTLDDLIALRPDVVIEAAGQPAVVETGPAILAAGIDLMVISVGALADPAMLGRLTDAARAGGSEILLPAGGIAGLDGLRAMVCSGATQVTYTSAKPPHSWIGTPADGAFDLRGMTERTVLFSGPATQAALRYPKNANLAATVALAGVGLERTRIELVADPALTGLLGIIEAQGDVGTMRVEVFGRMAQGNAKTSAVVGMSALAALVNDSAALRFV